MLKGIWVASMGVVLPLALAHCLSGVPGLKAAPYRLLPRATRLPRGAACPASSTAPGAIRLQVARQRPGGSGRRPPSPFQLLLGQQGSMQPFAPGLTVIVELATVATRQLHTAVLLHFWPRAMPAILRRQPSSCQAPPAGQGGGAQWMAWSGGGVRWQAPLC